jgi:hypothetical protein
MAAEAEAGERTPNPTKAAAPAGGRMAEAFQIAQRALKAGVFARRTTN